MTTLSLNDRFAKARSDVSIWRCGDCHCTHIRAGETLLTFTSAEFATFAEAIGKCFRQQNESIISSAEEIPTDIINISAIH